MSVPTNAVFYQGSTTPITADSLNSFMCGALDVAALRSFTGLDNMTVWLLGTSVPNDGGTGPFWYDAASTATDDGGVTAIAPTGSDTGRWLRMTISEGTSSVVNLTVSGVLTIGTNTTLTSDGATITVTGALATTGLATLGDLAVSASHSASNVLIVSSAAAGVPTWRRPTTADIAGLGTMATQNATAVAITGGTVVADAVSAASGTINAAAIGTLHVLGNAVVDGTIACAGGAFNTLDIGFLEVLGNTLVDGQSHFVGNVLCDAALACGALQSHEISPETDNTWTNGDGTHRWTVVYATNGTINTSDIRDKVNVEDADLGLDFLMRLRPVKYEWRWGSGTRYGIIAQELKAAMDEAGADFEGWRKPAVSAGIEGRQGWAPDQFVTLLIKAVQELSARVASLEGRGA